MTQKPALLNNALAIVKAQGALFIREFLRTKKQAGLTVKIGSTKAQSLTHLSEALDQQIITLEDLDQWISEVEGWGHQHVYLYHELDSIYAQHLADTVESLSAAIKNNRYHHQINQPQAFDFPEQLTLQQILISQEGLELIWRQKATDSLRTPAMDLENAVIDGDIYQFRAYRITPARNVIRMLFNPRKHQTALFIQLPLGQAHRKALESCEQTMAEILGLSQLHKKPLSESIKKLDQLDMSNDPKQLNLEAHSTKFSAAGASIEFSASKHISGFKQIEPVRLVRKALNEAVFSGTSGQFNIHLEDTQSQIRTIQMTANAISNKYYFKAKMTAREMHNIIDFLAPL